MFQQIIFFFFFFFQTPNENFEWPPISPALDLPPVDLKFEDVAEKIIRGGYVQRHVPPPVQRTSPPRLVKSNKKASKKNKEVNF